MEIEEKASYLLSDSTMALIPTEVNGMLKTLIYDENKESAFMVNESPHRLVNEACQSYGEDMISRSDGAKFLCDFTSKTPIAISTNHNMFFFPNESPTSNTCSWFSHSHIRRVFDGEYGGTRLKFKNGLDLYVPTSRGIMNNQVYKTAQYRFILLEHLKSGQQKFALEMILKALGLSKMPVR